MNGTQPVDLGRLPWLEPYREPGPRTLSEGGRPYGGLAAVGTALILLPAGIGAGYWLGQRSDSPAAIPSQPSTIVVLPPVRPVKVDEGSNNASSSPEVGEAESSPVQTDDAPNLQSVPVKVESAKPVEAKVPKPAPPSKTRSVEGRAWPKMPSPGPPGQVIQLGAFSTSSRASKAYDRRIARYPQLANLPRVIVPIISQPDGRLLYALRLGTTSRQHSRELCRKLNAGSDHCLVIG